MKKITSLFLYTLLLSPLLHAADPLPPPMIEVTGEGVIKVEPDQAVLRFGIETFGPKLKDVQNENAKRSQALVAALKARGVKPSDVQTELLQISPRYDFDKGKRKFVEYTAQKSFTVTLNDLALYGAVLEAVLDAGVDSVDGLQFQSSKKASLQDDARKAAMKDAKRRADLLAGTIGQGVGKAIRIQEQMSEYPYPAIMSAMAPNNFNSRQADVIATGEISVKSSVQVQFELK